MSLGIIAPSESASFKQVTNALPKDIHRFGNASGLVDLADIGKNPKAYFSPEGKYLWDPWFPRIGDTFHAFYLQCPRDSPYNRRHTARVEIGHATTNDLIHFHEQPTALIPGKQGEWDGLSIWDGTMKKVGGLFNMFYTGIGSLDMHQQIGLATSYDLINWQKHPGNPILMADHRHYGVATQRNVLGNPSSFRDPYLFKDERSGRYHMSISAREPNDNLYNGCVALASTEDMIKWELEKPIFAPKRYDEIEETKIIQHDDRYYLFFSTYARNYEPAWAQKVGAHDGLHCYVADELRGEYKPANDTGVVKGMDSMIYGGKVLKQEDGSFLGMGWLDQMPEGTPIARMARPFKIIIRGLEVFAQPLGKK